MDGELKNGSCFLTGEQSFALRGIGALLVIVSHLSPWYAEWAGAGTAAFLFSRAGVYGGDLFFLVSGYGLTKSALARRPGLLFWEKRLRGTYLPYLLIVGLAALFSGGMKGAGDWYRYLTGYDHWFIRNILIFYGVFFAVYRWGKGRGVRTVLMGAVVLGYSCWLIWAGRAEFWYLSNPAFFLGTALAEWERELMRPARSGYALQLSGMAALLALAATAGGAGTFSAPGGRNLFCKTAIGVLWTLFAVQAGGLIGRFSGCLRFLGRISLELYLLHMFVFYQMLNLFAGWGPIVPGAVSLAVSVPAAWIFHRAFTARRFAGALHQMLFFRSEKGPKASRK